MIVKLLTEHHLEFLSLKVGRRGSSESTHVKMPHCWKSHALAHMSITTFLEITCQVHLSMEVLVSCLLAGSMRFRPCNQLRIAMLLAGTIYKLIYVKIW